MQQRPNTVRLIRIFVSSPGDVSEERKELEEAIKRINGTHGQIYGVRLESLTWERHVVPQIGPRPQAVVDAQIPAYDVYLGIMSSRFGTPNGTYGSGTEKEFRDAAKRWHKVGRPWILFYFNDTPTPSKKPADVLQYLKVCTFRKKLEKLGIAGTYTGVRGSNIAFFDQVEQHLGLLIQDHLQPIPLLEPLVEQENESGAPPPPVVPAAYRDWLRRQCADVNLELRPKKGHAVRLNNVYVPLKKAALKDTEEQEPTLLLELLHERSAYISGDTGTGKSTFCRWIAWLACEGTMPAQKVVPPEEYVESFPEALRNRLPLLVLLRDFWDYLPLAPGRRELSKMELTRALERWITETRPGDLEWTVVKAHLDQGTALLVLDGLDEVPPTHGEITRPSSPREMLLSGLGAAIPDWICRRNHVLVTSRSNSVNDEDAKRLSLLHVPIAGLDDPAQDLLVRRWFHHFMTDRPAAAEATAQGMIDDVRGQEGLEPLAANPLLLTAMCILYSEGKGLPQDKYALYDRIVEEVLLRRYSKDAAVIDLVRRRLNVIAHGMHTGIRPNEHRATPQVNVTIQEIELLLTPYLDDQRPHLTEPYVKDVLTAREDLLSRSGLLLRSGEGQASFYHPSFQEFFAAQWLERNEPNGEGLLHVFESRALSSEWRGTLAFLFGAVLATSANENRALKLLAGLIKRLTPVTVGLQVAVRACLEILLGRGRRFPELEDKFRKICLESIAREVQPVGDRAALALTLGKLGDPRIVDDLRDRSAYVEVRADKYIVGEKRPFRLDKPILLARYPVVNRQYELFMQDKGYDNLQWWSDDGRRWLEMNYEREPLYWRNGGWNGHSQPVVGVSLWEAEAFAAWAGGRLPTEWEWEASARGPEGLEYPWGDDWADGICNTGDVGLGVTSPVGIFPRSRSKAFGLEDMAGNLWEWCSDFYSNEDRSVHVARGGCWGGVSKYALASYRTRFQPGDRIDDLGFRVVRVA